MVDPEVIPQQHRVPNTQLYMGNSHKGIHKFGHIFPPKRATELSSMGHSFMIISVPDKRYPGHILFIVKLVKILHQESLVLQLQIEDTQANFILGSANKVPCRG